jgi:hypothetical protein
MHTRHTYLENCGDFSLKGQCHEIFIPQFFSSKYPFLGSNSQDKSFLNMASNLLRYLRYLLDMIRFSGINETTGVDSALSMRPLKQIQQSQ